jgi:hypothetical protein
MARSQHDHFQLIYCNRHYTSPFHVLRFQLKWSFKLEIDNDGSRDFYLPKLG